MNWLFFFLLILIFLLFYLIENKNFYTLEFFYAKKKTEKEITPAAKKIIDQIIKQKWVKTELDSLNSKWMKGGEKPISLDSKTGQQLLENLRIWFNQSISKKNKIKRYNSLSADTMNKAKHVWSNMLKETTPYFNQALKHGDSDILKAFKKAEPDINNELKEGNHDSRELVKMSIPELQDYYLKNRKEHPDTLKNQRDKYAFKFMSSQVKKNLKSINKIKSNQIEKDKNIDTGKKIAKGLWKKECPPDQNPAECLKNKIISYNKEDKSADSDKEQKLFLEELKKDPVFSKLKKDALAKGKNATQLITSELKPVIDWSLKQSGPLKNVAGNLLGPAAIELGGEVGSLFGGPLGAFLTKKIITGSVKGAKYLYNLYLIRKKEKKSGVNNIKDLLNNIFTQAEENKIKVSEALNILILILQHPPMKFPEIFGKNHDKLKEENWDIFTMMAQKCGNKLKPEETKVKKIIELMKKETFQHITSSELDRDLPANKYGVIHTYIYNKYNLPLFLPHGYPKDYKECLAKWDDKYKETFLNYY